MIATALSLRPHDLAYLHPGFLFASRTPTSISAVLGSCVAVCLWEPRLRIGGANHFLLPHSEVCERGSARYGTTAVPALVDALERLGCRRERLRAKVFGGASINVAFRLNLAADNAGIAISLLDEIGIGVEVVDTLGSRGRKIIFDTDTGRSEVRYL